MADLATLRPYKCAFEFCNAAFFKPNLLQRHLCSHTGQKPYKCDYSGCRSEYVCIGSLKRHIEKFHKEYICDDTNIAEYIVKDVVSINTVLGTKKSKELYKCTYDNCHKEYTRPSRLLRHQRTHTGERPFKCDYPDCNKTYGNSSHLIRHKKSHAPENDKKFICKDCLKKCKNLYYLKKHYENAHGDKNKCKECNLTFKKKSQLAQHVVIHNDFESLKRCEQCDKLFVNEIKFTKHCQKYHKKSYSCLHCTETFQNWSLLCLHKKKNHLNEYKCKDCDKVFFKKARLKAHSKLHTESPLLKCPYDQCHRSYAYKRNLDLHIRTKHLNEKYICDICSTAICSKQKLISHIQTIHQLSQNKVRKEKNEPRKRRKDAGSIKQSIISPLIGLMLPINVQKALLQRDTKEVELHCTDL
ncbi:zinc finger protein 624-like [Prorops nasuta]|uniref:zinc finger protein 624-like n=1 Tax=Prorops nasuta TaxID=863751 RepID=UPI0034CE299C